MSYALNNITPPDVFDEANGVLRCPNSRTVTLQVYNQAILYQLQIATVGVNSGGEQWEPSSGAFLGPGAWNFSETDFRGGVCHAVRVRAAAPALPVPAAVSISA